MMTPLQAVRGMNDLLPSETPLWTQVERTIEQLLSRYGYREIRLPILEKTELFRRSIGEVTDIVEKEMYTFVDRNQESLTLRPEGTAGCVRAGIEHGLLQQTQKLWYRGPMFRHERPQKGRYRQFHQVGVEVYGLVGPDIDAELIALTARLWKQFKLDVVLQLNSLGSPAARVAYRERLVRYFTDHFDALDEDSQRRLQTNPLRILDTKNPDMQALVSEAPSLLDHLDGESARHFAQLQQWLDAVGITYHVNPRLVRGLDYYSQTVFEWVTDKLGAQATVCAGGRYDGLVEQLGGKPTPAIGFAIGLERLVALLADQGLSGLDEPPHAYLVTVGEKAETYGFVLAEQLRDALPQLRLYSAGGGGTFKTQLKRADRSGALWAIIIGDDEVANQCVSLKPLRETAEQITVPVASVAPVLRDRLGWVASS